MNTPNRGTARVRDKDCGRGTKKRPANETDDGTPEKCGYNDRPLHVGLTFVLSRAPRRGSGADERRLERGVGHRRFNEVLHVRCDYRDRNDAA